MPKCSACRRLVASSDAVSCSVEKCSNVFHKECVKVSRTGPTGDDWICPECKAKVPRDNRAGTPVSGMSKGAVLATEIEEEHTTVITTDMITRSEYQEMMREMRSVCNELKSFVSDLRNEVRSLTGAVSACNGRLDHIEKRLEQVECAPKNDMLTDETKATLQDKIDNLKSELNNRDQNDFLNDVEITGLPEVNGENIMHTSLLLATKLGIVLEETDVVWARRAGRLRQEPGSRPRPVQVRLTRRALRDALLKSARVRRGLSAPDSDARVYVNERLTYVNRMLFRQTRELARKHNFRFVWSKDGKIFTRESEGRPARRIRTQQDLVDIFGDYVGVAENM